MKCGHAVCEARRADARGPKRRERGKSSWEGVLGTGFLGGGSEPPPHQLEGLGSIVSSLSGVPGKAPEN